jgi:hypothetical protein
MQDDALRRRTARERVEVFERWDNDNVGAPA